MNDLVAQKQFAYGHAVPCFICRAECSLSLAACAQAILQDTVGFLADGPLTLALQFLKRNIHM